MKFIPGQSSLIAYFTCNLRQFLTVLIKKYIDDAPSKIFFADSYKLEVLKVKVEGKSTKGILETIFPQ